jgi:hypothetical protein
VERAGVLAALVSFGWLLANSYSLVAFSDPMKWYTFARDFSEAFGQVRLAYGFPLVQAAAIAVVGPFYGFLVNVPILIGLAGLVYLFARNHVTPDDFPPDALPLSPVVVGAAALSFFVAVNWQGWLHSANPYRDPLSHSLVLAGCLGVIHWVRRGRIGPAALIAVGCGFAFAAAARETAVFILGPVALYVLAIGRTRDAFWRLVGMGAVILVASTPLLVQNAMLSGNPVLPGQMLRGMESQREFVPGIRFEYLASTLPGVLEHLSRQYGMAGLLVLVGVGVSVRRRLGVALALSVPALLLHVLFYGAYVRVVDRYLLIVDLFAAPLAGIGVAWIAGWTLRGVADPDLRGRLLSGVCALVFLPAVIVPLWGWRISEPAAQLVDARRLRADLLELMPPGARVMGERPMAEIVHCFAGDVLSVDTRRLKSTRLDAALMESERVFALTRKSANAEFASQYAVTRVAKFSGAQSPLSAFWVYEVRQRPDARPEP